MRNLIALLFASRGTPMLAMGAETGHSQGGNNNAYAQDNRPRGSMEHADASLAAFVGRLAAARREHPALGARPGFPDSLSTRRACPTWNGATRTPR